MQFQLVRPLIPGSARGVDGGPRHPGIAGSPEMPRLRPLEDSSRDGWRRRGDQSEPARGRGDAHEGEGGQTVARRGSAGAPAERSGAKA